MDGLAANRYDHIALLDSGLFGGTAGGHIYDECPFIGAAGLQRRLGPGVVRTDEADADRSARHLAGLDDLVVNGGRRVDGKRETDALIAAAAGDDADRAAGAAAELGREGIHQHRHLLNGG